MAFKRDGQDFPAVLLDRRQHNVIDQAAHDLGRLMAAGFISERRAQIGDLFAVIARHVRVDADFFFLCARQPGLQRLLAGFQFSHLVFDPRCRNAVHERLYQPVKFAFQLYQFRLVCFALRIVLPVQPVHVAGIFFAEDFCKPLIQQAVFQTLQDRRFQMFAPHCHLVIAGAFVAGIRAADIDLVEIYNPAAAGPAFHKAGEQVARAPPVPVAGRELPCVAGIKRVLPRLDLTPQVLTDNPQLRHIPDNQLVFRIGPRDFLACLRVFDIAQAVPDQPADIKFVIENAGAALPVAVNGARSPALARGRGNIFRVELLCDCPRRNAGGIFIEDAADDPGLHLIDFALAADGLPVLIHLAHDIITVGVAAAGFAGLDAPAQAAPCLVGKVFEKERIHRALKPDMQLIDLAFCQRHQPDAKKGELFVKPCYVRLIAGKPVKGFGDNDLKLFLARIAQQLLDAGAHHARAGGSAIAVAFGDMPPFTGGAFFTNPDLIFD